MLKPVVLALFLFVGVLSNDTPVETATYPIAWSPDGELIASSGTDGNLDIWRSNGQRLLSIETGDAPLTALAWSPDSQWLASAGRKMRIWDMKTGKQAYTLRVAGHADLHLIWSPGGTRLAALAADGLVHIWSAADWSLITTTSDVDLRFVRWQGEQLALHAPTTLRAASILDVVAWNADETIMAGAQPDGKIRLWSTINGERIATLYGHRDSVRQMLYSPSGQQLLSAGMDGTLRIWDLTTWNEADRVQWPGTPITWSPDGKYLAWLSADDATVEIFEAVTEPVKSPCDLCAG